MCSNLESTHKVYLWGPCCAADLVGKYTTDTLPELEEGDWLFYENMGAYSISLWMPFNGMPKPKIHYFIRESRRCVLSNPNYSNNWQAKRAN